MENVSNISQEGELLSLYSFTSREEKLKGLKGFLFKDERITIYEFNHVCLRHGKVVSATKLDFLETKGNFRYRTPKYHSLSNNLILILAYGYIAIYDTKNKSFLLKYKI